MTIGVITNGIITITPNPNMGVTNGETVADSIVYLGKLDSPDNWHDCELPTDPDPDTDATEQDYQDALRRLGASM